MPTTAGAMSSLTCATALQDALAKVAGAAVAELDRLVHAGGGAGGYGGGALHAARQRHHGADGGVAARVQKLECTDVFDDGHGWSSLVVMRNMPANDRRDVGTGLDGTVPAAFSVGCQPVRSGTTIAR